MKFFKKVKHIHFVGIGGAGMIGIAKVLLKKGYKGAILFRSGCSITMLA